MMHQPKTLSGFKWRARRSARFRLMALYGGLFVLSGVTLLTATYLLFERATAYSAPDLPRIPHTKPIKGLPSFPRGSAVRVLQRAQFFQAQQDVGQAQRAIAGVTPSSLVVLSPPKVAEVEEELTSAQHQLSQGEAQLAQAVHQLAEVAPTQAAQRSADSHQLLVNSAIALAIVALLALLAGWLIAGRMLRPIRTITWAAKRISSSNLHERLAFDGPHDELKELSDTLDDLFARLEDAFEAQRHFVANASHELRTPLTRERTLVEVALGDPSTPEVWRSTGEELLASNREQESLIEALLTLASSESDLDRFEEVDLAAVTRRILSDRPEADPFRLQIDVAIAPAALDGNPRLVEVLVANLVDNAIIHNVEGGHVDVSVDAEDGAAVLTVANTGPVIEPGDLQRLFEPFQRLDARRVHHKGGHGLGLSIVRAIAAAHRAELDAVPATNGGLSVTVRFPAPSHSLLSPSPAAALIAIGP